jgi:hypothetical protein
MKEAGRCVFIRPWASPNLASSGWLSFFCLLLSQLFLIPWYTSHRLMSEAEIPEVWFQKSTRDEGKYERDTNWPDVELLMSLFRCVLMLLSFYFVVFCFCSSQQIQVPTSFKANRLTKGDKSSDEP